MLMQPTAIHQFHEGSAYGDGITNGMLYVQRILKTAGYDSEIYCYYVAPELEHTIKHLTSYIDAHNTLLLVHHSLGHGQEKFLSSVSAKKILIYHNITPAEYFEIGSVEQSRVNLGIRQLLTWSRSGFFIGAIADSDYNASELRTFGYTSVVTLPLLVDLELVHSKLSSPSLDNVNEGAANLLFVGRVCESKGQIDAVRVTYILKRLGKNVKLHLIGSFSSGSYVDKIKRLISDLDLDKEVTLYGHLSDEVLYSFYTSADIYISMSRHEGFGMPLIEAMAANKPIVALRAGAVAETIDGGGLVIEGCDHVLFANTLNLLLEEPSLRTTLIMRQNEVLNKFDKISITEAFTSCLRQFGCDVNFNKEHEKQVNKNFWRVEGPFDTSYSLAIVNRNLAKALLPLVSDVCLLSRDGFVAYEPNSNMLSSDPIIDSMYRSGISISKPHVSIRNQYPPTVIDQSGSFNMLGSHGWEESGYPAMYVNEINVTCNMVTVVSEYVKKTMRDNGVRCPIFVVGNGIDHVNENNAVERISRAGVLGSVITPEEDMSNGTVVFLHISTGLPRKGIDVLLKAWSLAFTRRSNVKLIIKTTENIHNFTREQIDQIVSAESDLACLVHISDELSPQEVRDLILECDVVVAPSRGEGFGLPLAEAFICGKPVITTAFGGQRDFCNEDNAWLCDFDFSYAITHMQLSDSVWAEPSIPSLVDCLRKAAESRPNRIKKGLNGKEKVETDCTWAKVASRTHRAYTTVIGAGITPIRLPVVGWLSTWNSKCGIAEYSKFLSKSIGSSRLKIFANSNAECLENDPSFVQRCWQQGWDDNLDVLWEEISSHQLDALVIQFNFGFFDLGHFSRFIKRVAVLDIPIYIVFHSTADVESESRVIRLADFRYELSLFKSVFVHAIEDMNRLKRLDVIDNVTLLPMGMPLVADEDDLYLKHIPKIKGRKIIACFGFLLPHKGIKELVVAFASILEHRSDLQLVLLNSIYPVEASRLEGEAVRNEIAQRGIEDNVSLITEYVSDGAIAGFLKHATLIVYPYQATQESSSAAVRAGLASLKPVLCTPLQIFDNVSDVVLKFPGLHPKDLAAGIETYIDPDNLPSDLSFRQSRWVDSHQWSRISQMFDNVLRGNFVESLISSESIQKPIL